MHNSGNGGRGGGVFHKGGSLLLTDCEVTENQTGINCPLAHGGGIYAEGTDAILSNCWINANSTGSGNGGWGGGLCNAAGSLTILDCVISTNVTGSGVYVGGHGGGIYHAGAAASIVGTLICSNRTGGTENYYMGQGGDGGGVYSIGNTLLITNCSVIGNATGPAGSGGGIHNAGGPFALLSSIICDNAAGTANGGGKGGGVCNSGGTLIMSGDILERNRTEYGLRAAGSDGGALCNVSATSFIDSCTFSFNSAGTFAGIGRGGAIYNGGPSLNLTNCSINDNASAGNGGGVCSDAGRLSATRCIISGNAASRDPSSSDGRGGGLYLGDTGTGRLELDTCSIESNAVGRAGRGGGLYVSAVSASLSNTCINANATGAGGPGGGIYCDAGALSLVACTVSTNFTGDAPPTPPRAGGPGGGIYCVDVRLNLRDCSIHDNQTGGGFTGGDGGGVYCENTLASAEQTIIFSNRCRHGNGSYEPGARDGWGGGAFATGGFLSMSNCLLFGNDAESGGGAYRAALQNCTVAMNTANINGGGVCEGTLLNCIVHDNSAATSNDLDSCTALYTCASPAPDGVGNMDVPPSFRNAAGGDFRLTPASPCIDAGLNQSWMPDARDLDSNPRLRNRHVDLGAYEFAFSGSVRAFLQGPYSTNTHSMTATLATNLPHASPYAVAPQTAETIGSNTTDWVLLQVLDAESNSIRFSRSALLRNDGVLVDENGSPDLAIELQPLTTNRVRISHRNHLAIMTAAAIPFTTLQLALDFTTDAATCAGGTNACCSPESGAWAMIAGDTDGDGRITAVDRTIVQQQLGKTGYLVGDLNLDGVVNDED